MLICAKLEAKLKVLNIYNCNLQTFNILIAIKFFRRSNCVKCKFKEMYMQAVRLCYHLAMLAAEQLFSTYSRSLVY